MSIVHSTLLIRADGENANVFFYIIIYQLVHYDNSVHAVGQEYFNHIHFNNNEPI